MDENQDVNTGEIVLPEEPSTLKQTTEDESQDAETEASDTKVLETETAESNKGANQRIRELNQQKKAAEARAQSLAEKLAELTEPIGLPNQQIQYTPQIEPGTEITPEQYQGDVAKNATALVDLKIAQNNATNRIRNESLDVVRKYPQLDPESDSFDRELSDAVTEATEAHVRNAPYTASVNKFVDRLMKPYLGAAAKEVGKVTENIAKQVSETALRPTSVRQPEKSATEKSMAELERDLGVVQS